MGFLDSIGSAISSAAGKVTDIVEDVVSGDIGGAIEGAGSFLATGGFLPDIADAFEAITKDLGPIGDIVDGAMDILSSGSLGGMLNTAMDKLGLPDWIGDVGGGVLDFCTGNFVGAAANGLDALQDVADACGGQELGGFLKAGSKITGMFTGGVGGTGIGEIDSVISTVKNTAATVDKAMDGVQALASGDIVGAGASLLGTFGDDLGALESLVGNLGEDVKDALDGLLPRAKSVLGALGGALADGKLDLNDLQQLPMGDLVGSLFGEDAAKQLEDVAGPAIAFFKQASGIADQLDLLGSQLGTGIADAVNQASHSLLDGVVGLVADQLGQDHPDLAKLNDFSNFASQLFGMGVGDPNALSVIGDLLSQAGGLSGVLEQIAHQNIALRA